MILSIDEAYLEEAQNDVTLIALDDQYRVYVDIVTDGNAEEKLLESVC